MRPLLLLALLTLPARAERAASARRTVQLALDLIDHVCQLLVAGPYDAKAVAAKIGSDPNRKLPHEIQKRIDTGAATGAVVLVPPVDAFSRMDIGRQFVYLKVAPRFRLTLRDLNKLFPFTRVTFPDIDAGPGFETVSLERDVAGAWDRCEVHVRVPRRKRFEELLPLSIHSLWMSFVRRD